MEHLREEEVYEGCRRGDAKMQHALYQLYGGRLLSVAMRYTDSRSSAEDLLHDVFVSVLTNFNKFTYKGEGSLWGWLKRVMINAALDELRRRRTDRFEEIEDMIDDGTIPSDSLRSMNEVPVEEIMKMISKLPPGYRMVFNLYAFEGKSHRQIAEILGIKEKSSASQLTRARQILVKEINDYLKN